MAGILPSLVIDITLVNRFSSQNTGIGFVSLVRLHLNARTGTDGVRLACVCVCVRCRNKPTIFKRFFFPQNFFQPKLLYLFFSCMHVIRPSQLFFFFCALFSHMIFYAAIALFSFDTFPFEMSQMFASDRHKKVSIKKTTSNEFDAFFVALSFY